MRSTGRPEVFPLLKFAPLHVLFKEEEIDKKKGATWISSILDRPMIEQHCPTR
jgi:hypothetical protein